MEISIGNKPAFLVAGHKAEGITASQCPGVWEALFKAHDMAALEALGKGQSLGVCYGNCTPESFNYMAGYDCADEAAARALGLELLEVPAADYAVVQLQGKVPACIQEGWQYLMGTYFPQQAFKHAGTPDFELYEPGDMDSDDYRMTLWVPIASAQ